MNNGLSNMNLGEIMKTAIEGPHGPLALTITGILIAFGIADGSGRSRT
ncbi:MAG: hypothetical protein IJ260_05120 [Butyrivibrio sp.]|nr:hypothetical protein [Butyrivibrio sp.]